MEFTDREKLIFTSTFIALTRPSKVIFDDEPIILIADDARHKMMKAMLYYARNIFKVPAEFDKLIDEVQLLTQKFNQMSIDEMLGVEIGKILTKSTDPI